MRTTFTRCADGWSEDTRITHFKQVTVVPGAILCVLARIILVLWLVLFLPAVAVAGPAGQLQAPASPGDAAISIVPADGKPRGIRLRSQTVSTVVTEGDRGVWADTDLEVQLQNRGRDGVVLPIAVPGSQVSTYPGSGLDLPQILEASADKKPVALVSTTGNQPAIQASTVITLPAQGTVTLRLRYRQQVPVHEDLAAYAYPLLASNVWAGAPESLSVSLAFISPLAGEQILYLTPGSRAPKPGTYVWAWNGAKAPANLAIAFLTSGSWRELEAARAAAAAPGASLELSDALAEQYWRLATLVTPAFAAQASFYERSVPLAVAAWRAGIAAAGPDTPPLGLSRAHERLAGVYLAEGNRAGGDAAQTYLQLAAGELAAAVALNPTDQELASSATALQERLAQAAANRGDGTAAAVHRARLAALASGQAAPAPEQQAQQEATGLAEAAVRSGDLAEARWLLEDGFGPAVLALPDARPPAITQALLQVQSGPTGRKIALQLLDEDQGESAGRIIEQTAEALRRVAPVKSAGDALTVTLAFTDPTALVAAQAELAAALPRLPELALLSSALGTRRLAWPEEAGLLARTVRYEERVDLARSAATWTGEAQKLEAAAAKAASSSDRLDQLRAVLWRSDARTWRDLAALSRATYRVELQERGAGPEWLQARVHEFYREGSIGREWVVRAGETRQLEAAVLGWRYDRLAMAAGAAILIAALTVVLLWLVAR